VQLALIAGQFVREIGELVESDVGPGHRPA